MNIFMACSIPSLTQQRQQSRASLTIRAIFSFSLAVKGVARLNKQRILVVDDDPEIVSVLKRGLAYEGYMVDKSLQVSRSHEQKINIEIA